MSAETLRGAAELMRHVETDGVDAVFMLAVADLLDEIALRWEYVEERELAVAVARAYLGEDV